MKAIFLVVALSLTSSGGVKSQEYIGELVLKALDDGRSMELVRDFGFTDIEERTWLVPSGWKVDGASIPWQLWSFIGGPFSGKYRNASVIHDYYCDVKRRPWPQVHRTFYEAMIASGVDRIKAMIMYYAVYRFGPRWDFNITVGPCRKNAPCYRGVLQHFDEYKPIFNDEEFNGIKDLVIQSPEMKMSEVEAALDIAFEAAAVKEFLEQKRFLEQLELFK